MLPRYLGGFAICECYKSAEGALWVIDCLICAAYDLQCYSGNTTSHPTKAQNDSIAAHVYHKKVLTPAEELITQMDDKHAFRCPTAERMGIGLPSCMYFLLVVHHTNESMCHRHVSFAVLAVMSMPLSSLKSPTPLSPGYTHPLLDGRLVSM